MIFQTWSISFVEKSFSGRACLMLCSIIFPKFRDVCRDLRKGRSKKLMLVRCCMMTFWKVASGNCRLWIPYCIQIWSRYFAAVLEFFLVNFRRLFCDALASSLFANSCLRRLMNGDSFSFCLPRYSHAKEVDSGLLSLVVLAAAALLHKLAILHAVKGPLWIRGE